MENGPEILDFWMSNGIVAAEVFKLMKKGKGSAHTHKEQSDAIKLSHEYVHNFLLKKLETDEI